MPVFRGYLMVRWVEEENGYVIEATQTGTLCYMDMVLRDCKGEINIGINCNQNPKASKEFGEGWISLGIILNYDELIDAINKCRTRYREKVNAKHM